MSKTVQISDILLVRGPAIWCSLQHCPCCATSHVARHPTIDLTNRRPLAICTGTITVWPCQLSASTQSWMATCPKACHIKAPKTLEGREGIMPTRSREISLPGSLGRPNSVSSLPTMRLPTSEGGSFFRPPGLHVAPATFHSSSTSSFHYSRLPSAP